MFKLASTRLPRSAANAGRWPYGNRPDELQAVLADPDQHDNWRAIPITRTNPGSVHLTTTYEADGGSHRSLP